MAKLNSGVIAGRGVTLQSAVLAGAAANTNIAVAGYTPHRGAQVVALVDLTGDADLQADVVATIAGNIKISVDTTAKKLLLIWTQRA